MIRLSRARSTMLGAIALTAVIFVAGCSSSSAGSGGSGSGTTQNTAFRKCLEQHGITPPSGGGFGGGSGAPHPRPTGSASASFRQAIQACGGPGGGHFGGGSGSAG